MNPGVGLTFRCMKNYSWENSFLEIFESCTERYRAGSRDPAALYMPDEMAFISSIGYKPREFFDFIEDYVDEGEPSPITALLIASVRRDYFLSQQDCQPSIHEVTPDELPPRDAELDGIRWLPRIITKARAKLRGELHPDIMYACGGDRNFLRQHDIHPADFLRFLWGAGNDEEKIAGYVKQSR